MNHNCLNCKHWDRLYENPDVGVCELHNDSIIPACKSQAEIERAFDLNMPDTPDRHLRELADALNRAVEAVEVKYSPDQPREPAGSPEGGQWVRQESPGGRAPAGLPTLAMNGLIYYPGEFLPSTELMPLEKKKREKIYKYMQKKQEIEPYKWELPPGPEYSPLLQRLSPIADWNKYRETGILEAVTNQNILDKFGGSDYQGLINLWNSGERWYINPYRLAELNKSVDLDKQEESVEAVEVKYSDSQPRVPVLDRAKVRRESECGCNSRTNLCRERSEMTDKLKPCPFCGAPAKSITMGSPGVTCPKGCCYIFGKTKTEVVERWNERRAEDELNKIIDKFASVGTDLYHRVRAEFYEDASIRADWRELMHTYRKEWVI